jgi:hypothetical protein
MTQVEAEPNAVDAPDGDDRVVVISYTMAPPRRVIDYVRFLREQGIEVDVIAWDERRWQEAEPDLQLPAGVPVHSVNEYESRQFFRRTERIIVRRIPEVILAQIDHAVQSNRVTQPLHPAIRFCRRAHGKLAGAFHRQIFLRFYAFVRPNELARATRRALGDTDLGQVSRIVAADPNAITTAWRLAQQYPNAIATTRLDRHPYLEAGPSNA